MVNRFQVNGLSNQEIPIKTNDQLGESKVEGDRKVIVEDSLDKNGGPLKGNGIKRIQSLDPDL